MVVKSQQGPFCVVFGRSPHAYMGFLQVLFPQPKNMYIRLTGDSKFPTGVSVCGYLLISGPAMDCNLSRVHHCLSPVEGWDRLTDPNNSRQV